jgi:hypothetical protein
LPSNRLLLDREPSGSCDGKLVERRRDVHLVRSLQERARQGQRHPLLGHLQLRLAFRQLELLARDVVRKIEEQLTYPGQIKVTVIRETRAVEYAK